VPVFIALDPITAEDPATMAPNKPGADFLDFRNPLLEEGHADPKHVHLFPNNRSIHHTTATQTYIYDHRARLLPFA
jgi:hypothetical protein